MHRAPAMMAAVAATLALVGCGSGGSGDFRAAPPAVNRTVGLKGKLSASEYRRLVSVITALERLDGLKDPHVAIARLDRVCSSLTSPRTTLVMMLRADCEKTGALMRAALAIAPPAKSCLQQARTGDPSCLVAEFTTLGHVAAGEAATARAVNRELRRRAIAGRCARTLGTSARELRAVDAIGTAAGDAASTLSSGDLPDYVRNARKVGRALVSLGGPDTKGSQSRAVRSCAHA